MKAIILGASFGRSLFPLPRDIPHALIKFDDKTVLDHLVGKLDRFPVINEIIVVSDQKFFPNFREWRRASVYQKPLRLIHNGSDEPGNHSGGLRDLEFALRSSSGTAESFLVFCGDGYFDFPLGFFLLPCLGHPDYTFIGLFETGEKSAAPQCAVAEMDAHGKIVRFEEKYADLASSNVNVGVYYIPARARLLLREYLIEARRQRPERIGDFMTWLVGRESVYGVVLDGVWFNAGFRSIHESVIKQVSCAN